MNAARSLNALLRSVRACTLCEPHLVDGVRPVVQVHRDARILIAGQAPGRRVHESGVPFDDPSGDRLRDWMGISRETFYDAARVAILPMGFCYPGKGKSGDLPPRNECAPAWRDELLRHLPNVGLTLVIGRYAQAWHLPKSPKTVTEAVRSWQDLGADVLPLPHPSPRNVGWFKKNPWFARDVIPELRQRISGLLNR